MSHTECNARIERELRHLIDSLKNQVKTIEMIEGAAVQTDFSYGEKTGLQLAIKIIEVTLGMKRWERL